MASRFTKKDHRLSPTFVHPQTMLNYAESFSVRVWTSNFEDFWTKIFSLKFRPKSDGEPSDGRHPPIRWTKLIELMSFVRIYENSGKFMSFMRNLWVLWVLWEISGKCIIFMSFMGFSRNSHKTHNFFPIFNMGKLFMGFMGPFLWVLWVSDQPFSG